MKHLPAIREVPFFRETEAQEHRIGFRPSMQNYLHLILFSVCIMVAGIVTGLEQGRKPLLLSQSEIARTAEIQQRISEINKSVTADFQPPATFSDFRMVSVNDTIEIHFGTSSIFLTGQAELNSNGEAQMVQLASVLFSAAKNAKITVEGYTDDSPMLGSTRYPSNWELSGARAARILRIFNKVGYSQDNLTFVGWGEAHPLLPNRNKKGTIQENRMRNRRVVIRLSNI